MIVGLIATVAIASEEPLMPNNSTVSLGKCGNCGIVYQGCCIGEGAEDHKCECHLKPDGNGSSAKNCGPCGVAFRACCLGTAAAHKVPCNCDIS